MSTEIPGGRSGTARTIDPEVAAARRRMFLQACRAYLVYGSIWSAIGVYVIVMPIPHSASSVETTVRLGGVFLLAFGLVRVFNALYRLRQVRSFDSRRRSAGAPPPGG